MTDFRLAYKQVHDSVIGFGWVQGVNTTIIGTGFVIHCNGRMAVVLTNQHVIEALNNANDGRKPAAIVFRNSKTEASDGEVVPMTEIVKMPILAHGFISEHGDARISPIPGFETIKWQAYQKPDLGIAVIDCARCRLPAVSLELSECPEEGLPVGLLGYPLGVSVSPSTTSESIQCTPILQTGVLSAILPNRDAPHRTLLIHIHSSGGCSGSPLFDATGKVLGVVFALRLDNGAVSSQLLVAPLTELPEEFRQGLITGTVDGIYRFLQLPAMP